MVRAAWWAALAALAALVGPAAPSALGQVLGLLPTGSAEDMLRGYVRLPATLFETPNATQPLSLARPGLRPTAHTDLVRFEPASWKRQGQRVGRLDMDTGELGLVTPLGDGGRWAAGATLSDVSTDLYLRTLGSYTQADASAHLRAAAVARRWPSGWAAAAGFRHGASNLGITKTPVEGLTLQAEADLSEDVVSLGFGRGGAGRGWEVTWERSAYDAGLAGQRGDAATYSALPRGQGDRLGIGLWRRRGATEAFAAAAYGSAWLDGPVAASGWERGAAGIGLHTAGLSLGMRRASAPRRVTHAALEWGRLAMSADGWVLSGVLPGLGDRGRGSGDLGAWTLAAKYARRRPVWGRLDLVEGLAVTRLNVGGSFLLEEAPGLLAPYEPTKSGWRHIRAIVAGLTAGLIRESERERAGLAATVYVGDMTEKRGSFPASPPGPPGPARPPTRLDRAFQLGAFYERRL